MLIVFHREEISPEVLLFDCILSLYLVVDLCQFAQQLLDYGSLKIRKNIFIYVSDLYKNQG